MTAREIVALRKKLGLSQAALAAKVGVHTLTVSRWERGVTKPAHDAVRLLRRMG